MPVVLTDIPGSQLKLKLIDLLENEKVQMQRQSFERRENIYQLVQRTVASVTQFS